MIDFLATTYHRLINTLTATQHRYLYDTFHIRNQLTGLIGPRGVGKTTMMLQYIKEHLYPNTEVFYFSVDNIYFNQITLLEFIDSAYRVDGIRIFFIDEIHKYPDWSQILKNIYDAYPDVKIIFSGSSSIDIVKGSSDLSRRATLFHLHGLSFREYLNFTTESQLSVIKLEDLLKHHVELSADLSQIKKISGHFKDYLLVGYYPFLFEDASSYYEKINRVIEKTIYEDIANYYSLKTPSLHCFKNILNYLVSIPPGSISIHNIAKQLMIDDKTAFHYLTILQETGLLRFIKPYAKGKQILSKPEKIFLNNTTLHNALDEFLGISNEIGTKRELFFIQSIMNAGIPVYANDYADFQVKDYLFEIGGKNKTHRQIAKTKLPAFLVKDNILIGSANTIPLLYFGFCY
jgi:predicted AAA+ superfamily ATPase